MWGFLCRGLQREFDFHVCDCFSAGSACGQIGTLPVPSPRLIEVDLGLWLLRRLIQCLRRLRLLRPHSLMDSWCWYICSCTFPCITTCQHHNTLHKTGQTHDTLQLANVLPKTSQQLMHPGCLLLKLPCIKRMGRLKSGETIHDRAIY
jgi:hypothetical protein